MKTEQETAREIISLLDESTNRLDRGVLDRLYTARMQAVSHLVARRQEVSARSEDGSSSVLRLFGNYLHQHRIAMPAVIICSAALVAFIATQQLVSQPSIEHGDAFLLGAELPPEAFLDKGFDTWVARTSQQ
jgi:hypothetical protein